LQSEGFVNAGPAVYINSTGPNPIMVQVINCTHLLCWFDGQYLSKHCINSSSLDVQPSFQSTHPFGVSNIPIMGGVSGAFGIFNPSRSTGKVTWQTIMILFTLGFQAENIFLRCFVQTQFCLYWGNQLVFIVYGLLQIAIPSMLIFCISEL
jgi:hypothetical protein